jgi:hypothetical protein
MGNNDIADLFKDMKKNNTNKDKVETTDTNKKDSTPKTDNKNKNKNQEQNEWLDKNINSQDKKEPEPKKKPDPKSSNSLVGDILSKVTNPIKSPSTPSSPDPTPNSVPSNSKLITRKKEKKTEYEENILDEIEKLVDDIPEVEYMTSDDVREADTWVIYGEKSDGKTSFALTFPGNILVIQFDEKAGVIWKEDFNCDPRIRIVDVTKILRGDHPILYLKTSAIGIAYVKRILDKQINEGTIPDWILIDGFESYSEMAEMGMRYNEKLKLSEGVQSPSWKIRTMFLTQLHKKCRNTAKKGVLYTTYPYIEELVTFQGKTQKTKKPNWKKIIEKETDNLVLCTSEDQEEDVKFYVVTQRMKRGFYNGRKVDITTPKDQPRRGYQQLVDHAAIIR